MKHRIIILAILLPLLVMACNKDYFSELKHPIEIHGSFDPIYGIPLAKMSADVGTIVGMLDTNQDVVVYFGKDDVVSFQYNYWQHSILSWVSEKTWLSNSTKSLEDTLHFYKEIRRTHSFDIFKNLLYFDTNSFNINSFFVTIDADVQGFVNNSFQAVIAESADLIFDSLILEINCINGYKETLPLLISSEKVSVTELLESRHIPILKKYDLRKLVGHKPVSIDYTLRLCISLPENQMMAGSTFNEQISHIGVDSVTADFKAQLELPLVFYSNNTQYIDTLPLDLSNLEEQLSNIENDTLEGEHYIVHLNDSNCYMAFVVNNGLPLGLSFNVTFLDESCIPILSTLFEREHEISSSPIKPFPQHDNTYISDGNTHSQFKIRLSLNNLKELGKTRKMTYSLNLNTTNSELLGANPYVAVLKDDRLDIRSYIVVSPHADFALPLSHTKASFINR